MRFKCAQLLVAVGFSLGFAQDINAHQRSESFSRWEYSDGTLSVRYTISSREVSRLQRRHGGETLPTLLVAYLADQVSLQDTTDGEGPACELDRPFRALKSRPGLLQAEAGWRCLEIPRAVVINAFFDLAAEHSHFASFSSSDGFSQGLLTTLDRRWVLSETLTNRGTRGVSRSPFRDYLVYGVRHIGSGPDHLVFLIALLLVCRRGRDIIWAVTGFTLGHSVSLGLAVSGAVQPVIPAVEAAIGLSIVLVVVERAACNMRNTLPLALVCSAVLLLMIPLLPTTGSPARPALLAGSALFTGCYLLLARDLGGYGSFRLVISSLFGLVHGLGFASAFLESGAGSAGMLIPLAGFNIGVELGQLALVSALLGLGLVMKRFPRFSLPATELTAAVIGGLGVFWFIERLY